MIRIRWRQLAIPLLLALLTACPGFGDQDPAGQFTEVPAFPTYEQHVKIILDGACVECHTATPTNGAPPGIRLDVYDDTSSASGARSLASRIVTRAVDSPANPMPPTSRAPIGAIDKAILRKWNELGAPRNAADMNTNNGDLDAGNNGGSLSYADDILPIFQRHACTACHGVGLQQGNHRLDTLENLMTTGDNAPAVIPCNSAGSPLIAKLRTATVPFGELMPQGGPEIPQADVDTLAQWIDQGAETGMVCGGNNGDMDAGNNGQDDTGMDASNNGGVELVGQKRNFSGRFFVAMQAPDMPDGPLFFQLDAAVAADLSTVDFTLQALSADRTVSPRNPVGPSLAVTNVPFSDSGTFVLEVGRVTLGADVNPMGDTPLELSVVLNGYVCGGELLCGTVDGNLLAPVQRSLAGSTFGAVASANFAGVLPATTCQAGWCEVPVAANNGGNNGEMDAGMDAEADVPDVIVHPVAHPSFLDVTDIFETAGCWGCHGGSGGLSVRSPASTLAGGSSGPGVVPCQPDASLLIKRLRPETLNGASLMPLGRARISDAQLETLRNWVADGAAETYNPATCQ